MGLMDAFKETETVPIEVPNLITLLDEAARKEYLERAVSCGVKNKVIRQIFDIPKEGKHGNTE